MEMTSKNDTEASRTSKVVKGLKGEGTAHLALNTRRPSKVKMVFCAAELTGYPSDGISR